jgi:hypothetical protein
MGIHTKSVRACVFVVIAAGGSAMVGVAKANPVPLQNASATFSQTFDGGYLASEMLDGFFGPGNGWAVFNGGVTSAQTAVMETVTDLTAPAVQFDLHQFHGTNHTLGRFRFSVTTDDRATFADGLSSSGDVSANWTVLALTGAALPAGINFSVLGDGSILIAGANPATAIYSLTFNLPFGGVTGVRLEALEDPSLPTGGPGRQTNGNFVVSELVATSIIPTPAAAALLGLGGLVATRRRRA